MARQVLAWECRYCGAIKKSQKIAVRHEKACMANPDRKNCIDCIHSYYEFGQDLQCRKRHTMCTRAISVECEEYAPKTNLTV